MCIHVHTFYILSNMGRLITQKTYIVHKYSHCHSSVITDERGDSYYMLMTIF